MKVALGLFGPKMLGNVKSMFGGGGDKGAAAALAAQRAEVEADARRVGTIEAGQRRARQGGAGGFRAFLEDNLKSTFGG
jgi:hypothetical protein